MPFINLNIKWDSTLDKESIKREILLALEKQFPDVEVSFNDFDTNTETFDGFVDELYNIAINNTSPSVH